MKDRKRYLILLEADLTQLGQAVKSLEFSLGKCKKIGIKDMDSFDPEELESFEALCSRFARTCDILFRKIWKTMDILELYDHHSNIDRLNRAEQRGLIVSADDFYELRSLRNRIANDYVSSELIQLFQQVSESTGTVIDAVHQTRLYCTKQFKLDR
jgi:hypothetical protein